MIDPLVKFGLRIKKARQWAGLSQADVAKVADLEPAHISHFECGRRKPSMRNLIRLADALDVSTDWLLGRVSNPNETLPSKIFRDLRDAIDRVEEKQKKKTSLADRLEQRGFTKRLDRVCGSPYCDKRFSTRDSMQMYCSEGCKPPGPPDPPPGGPMPRWG